MRRASAKIEVIVILLVITIVFTFAYVSTGRMRSKGYAQQADAKLRGLHQSWLIFAREFDGVFPEPGLIRRKPVNRDGVEVIIPGQGEVDLAQNTTANLYSASIMQNYFTPTLCIGPSEPSAKVMEDLDYNWDLYDPTKAIYWDDDFNADLGVESNVSYAHLPMTGERKARQWRESLASGYAMLSDRGPRDGDDPESITYKIHPPANRWSGYIIFNDNHSELTEQMEWGTVEVDDKSIPDNIFKMEGGPTGLDAFLGFTKTMTKEGPTLSWD